MVSWREVSLGEKDIVLLTDSYSSNLPKGN